MTEQDKFIRYIEEFHDKGWKIVEKKNKDYAGTDEPLRNFWNASLIAGVTVEQGLLVRMADKLARMRNLTEKGSLVGEVGEKFEDTALDLANYAAILAYFVTNNYNSEEVNQLKLPLEPTEEYKDNIPTQESNAKTLLQFLGIKK